jgi:septal ring factor EnvC (AmiA/AmiB activator)
MNSGTSNARVEQLHVRTSEVDSKIASQAATIAAQQKQIGILTTELKNQPAEIQKVSAQVEMNKSTKKVALNNH